MDCREDGRREGEKEVEAAYLLRVAKGKEMKSSVVHVVLEASAMAADGIAVRLDG